MSICRFTAENKALTRYVLTLDNQSQPFARVHLKRKRPVAILRDVGTTELNHLAVFLDSLQMTTKP